MFAYFYHILEDNFFMLLYACNLGRLIPYMT